MHCYVRMDKAHVAKGLSFQNEIQKYWMLVMLEWRFILGVFQYILAFWEHTLIAKCLVLITAFPAGKAAPQGFSSQFHLCCLSSPLLSWWIPGCAPIPSFPSPCPVLLRLPSPPVPGSLPSSPVLPPFALSSAHTQLWVRLARTCHCFEPFLFPRNEKRFQTSCFIFLFLGKGCGEKQRFKVLGCQRCWWTQQTVKKRLPALSRCLQLENTLLWKTGIVCFCLGSLLF